MNFAGTKLLRVKPEDPNGPYRESLASLFIRTARENDTSPAALLEQKFGNKDAAPVLRCSQQAFGQSIGQSLNGSGSIAQALVDRTESLTKLSSLRTLTTIAFSQFTTINGLLRQNLAWGAIFLRDSETKYYPLLWALDAVRVCPKAKKALMSICPKCREPMAVLTGSSWIGRCHRCRAVLEDGKPSSNTTDPVSNQIKNIDYEIWIAQQLGEFIELQEGDTLKSDFAYTDTLRFWFDWFDLGASAASARMLGVSQPAICKWLGDKSIPRLRTTMNLCWVFGLTLRQFLSCAPPAEHDGKLRESIDAGTRHASVSRRRRIDKAKLGHDLTSILRDNKFAMLPFETICQEKLGRRAMVVRQNFSDEARAIARRYLDNRRLMAAIQREQFCAAIRTTAKFLHSRGIVPNHKTLAAFLDRPSKLRCDWAIEALRQIRCELGLEDDGEQLALPL
ncbi:MAG: TniQ family protein [Opitutae bacterium]|nr:TniQ family protein [Opitutae bacterium]